MLFVGEEIIDAEETHKEGRKKFVSVTRKRPESGDADQYKKRA